MLMICLILTPAQGTFQYTSVAHINYPNSPKQIADELESFFHILIYYAARYLKSSLRTDEDAAHFLEKCYDCFTVTGERIICGSQKWALFKPGAVDIVFDHPEYTETHPVKFASESN